MLHGSGSSGGGVRPTGWLRLGPQCAGDAAGETG